MLSGGNGCRFQRRQGFGRIVLTAVAFCCFTIAAAAQSINTNNVFAGYSFLADNLFSGQHADLNGWNVSAEKKYLPFFGVVGDFAGFYGSAGPPSAAYCASIPASRCLLHSNVSQYSFSVGIRGSYGTSTIRPFGEALFGEIHTTESGMGISNVSNNFGATLGAGIDCRLTSSLGCRLVIDYIVTGNFTIARQNSIRATTGLVFRF
jgi:opacity protein-like surface antigen